MPPYNSTFELLHQTATTMTGLIVRFFADAIAFVGGSL